MKNYIALLRGINVGGHKKIIMANLRTALSDLGLKNVATYIQSGNVFFTSEEKNIKKLEQDIHNIILSDFGFEVPVLITTTEALQTVLDDCPFDEEVKQNSYFILFYNTPNADLVTAVSNISHPNETVIIREKCIYFYSSVGYGKAKFNNRFFEKKLKINSTARNYKTMLYLTTFH